MSHALLLRLFLSPYFSISVAMHYLKTYPESIGITHYLCWRMRGMSAEEVEFYWPQICHLIITRPSDSNALESFVLARAEESTHSAMLTFWFMQAALTDLTPTRLTNPRPFLICQRVLHKCHEIIFGDPPEPSRSPYRSLPHSPHNSTSALSKLRGVTTGTLSTVLSLSSSNRPVQRVNPHVPPALVGMGVILSSVAMPGLTDLTGQWAIMQGRRPRSDAGETRARVEVEKGGGADIPRDTRRSVSGSGQKGKMSEDSELSEEDYGETENTVTGQNPSSGHIILEKNSPRNGPSTAPPHGNFHHHPSKAAPSLVNSPSPLLSTPKVPQFSPKLSQKGSDPFSQTPATPPKDDIRIPHSTSPRHQPFNSVPEFSQSDSARRRLRLSNQPPPAETLLATYSPDAQRQLLRSHYCRSEVRFLLLLEDISNRLLVVPKPARVSALRAELTSLNHNLPAEVCMPLWCAADHSHEEGGQTSSGSSLPNRPDRLHTRRPKAHARVVRISPGDSVVLNSAERAPFLLHVEILEGDLDFDPTRRENRELLKKIVVAEDAKRRKREEGGIRGGGYGLGLSGPGMKAGLEGFGGPMPEIIPPISVNGLGYSDVNGSPINGRDGTTHSRQPSISDTLPPSLRKMVKPEELEEMDLVEQVYGAKLSVKNALPDITDSIPLPSAPRNKQLDLAAWDRDRSGNGLLPDGVSGLSRRSSYGGGLSSEASFEGGSALLVPIVSGGTAGLDVPLGSPALGIKSGQSSPGLPSTPESPLDLQNPATTSSSYPKRAITLEDYSERMRTAAVMLAQLNASLVPVLPESGTPSSGGALSWIPGTGWIRGSTGSATSASPSPALPASTIVGDLHAGGHPHSSSAGGKLKLAAAQAAAIRERIMEEMIALEEERVERMTERPEGYEVRTEGSLGGGSGGMRDDGKTAEDEGIVRRELNKADPSAAVFRESWTAKKSRIRAASPWGHLANWDVISVIVKTGADLRQEQLATQLIERFSRIWKEEKCDCWARFFRILITGESSGLVETITDAVSVHSIKKGEYARRIAEGGPIGQVSLMDHYVSTYGKPDSGRFARAQRNFIKSLAGYSIISYLLQIKDRHNGNILVDRDGHLIHIDFGFMLSNSPGNMGFEAAPFKMPMDYVEILGGLDSPGWVYFKKLFKEGFECARKHSDSLITIVELMQKDSKLDCFAMFGEQTAQHFRDRFALGLTTSAVDAYLERLILTSTGSNYTRLYDTFQYYSQGVL